VAKAAHRGAAVGDVSAMEDASVLKHFASLRVAHDAQ